MPSIHTKKLRTVAIPAGKIRQGRQVVIPKDIFDDLGLRVGDAVEVERVRSSVVIKPKKVADPEDTLTPEEAKIVRLGAKQIREGKSKSWRHVKYELGR